MIEKINENRESQILEAAKNIFTRKGYDGTSMQEIADQANISKSMLHYYFRSKDKLFEKIFSETFNKFLSQIALFLSEDIGIVEKIKMFISKHIDFISQNSSMPYFILNEINRNPSKIIKMMSSVFEKERTLLSFFSQIENEIKLGNIKPIDPKHLFINILY